MSTRAFGQYNSRLCSHITKCKISCVTTAPFPSQHGNVSLSLSLFSAPSARDHKTGEAKSLRFTAAKSLLSASQSLMSSSPRDFPAECTSTPCSSVRSAPVPLFLIVFFYMFPFFRSTNTCQQAAHIRGRRRHKLHVCGPSFASNHKSPPVSSQGPSAVVPCCL